MPTVIFDFDGTLADTAEIMGEIVNSLAEKFDFPPFTSDERNALRSLPAKDVLKSLITRGLKARRVPFFYRKVQQCMKTYGMTLPIFQGIAQMLQELHHLNFTLCIVSSNTYDVIATFLHDHKLKSYFVRVLPSKTVFGKHHTLQMLLKDPLIKTEKTIYVGDEIRDVIAAQKAKIPIVAVSWGFNSKESLISHKSPVVSCPGELKDYLIKWSQDQGQ